MLNDRDRRIRRATLKAVPWKASVDTATFKRELRRAFGQLSTDFSTSPIDIENGIFYSQLEVLVYRTPDGELEYRLSYVHPRDPRRQETGESAVRDAFDYAVLSGYARWELSDFFPETLLSAETARAYSLIPTVSSSQSETSAADDALGAQLALLIQSLDQTETDWGIQVVFSSAPRLSARSRVGIEIRVVTSDTATQGPSADESASIDPVTALTEFAEADTTFPFELQTWGDEFPTFLKQSAVHSARTESIPIAAAGAYCPVPRKHALQTGIGGAVNGLETDALDRIRHLTEPNRVLGVESSVDAAKPITDPVPFGLPDRATSVLSVVHDDTLSATVGQFLKRHVTTGGPTFVFATDQAIIDHCAQYYCHLTATASHRDPALPEHISHQQLDPFLTRDQVTELRPWFESLLDSDNALYLINLADADPESVGAHATLLVRELSNAAADIAETTHEQPEAAKHAGNVLVCVPELVETSHSHIETLETTLRIPHTTRLALDVITTYDVATATENRRTMQALGESADAILADNAGPVPSVLSTDQLPAAQQRTVERLDTTAPAHVFLARINRTDGLSEPVVLPLIPLHVTSYYTDPENLRFTASQRDELPAVLSQLSTVDVPTVGTVDTDALPMGATNRAATTAVHDRHVPRRTGLPPTVTYDDERDCYTCTHCLDDDTQNATRRDATNDGLRHAIECCHSLKDADRDALRRMPDPALKLTPDEIEASPLRRKHLRFLKGLYLVATDQVDPYFEYDPLIDSSALIRDDYGLSGDDIDLLKNQGYLTKDTHPHLLYSLTADGRHLLNEPWQEHREFGPDTGELTESLQHQLLVRAATLDYKQRYEDSPDRHVKTYVPVDIDTGDGTVTKYIDVAVVDDDGTVIHATEAERRNNDQSDSIERTYQKMRAADPESARWVVPRQTDAAALFSDLAAEGANGTIDYSGTTYSDKTAVSQMNPNEPGITDIETIRPLKSGLENIPGRS